MNQQNPNEWQHSFGAGLGGKGEGGANHFDYGKHGGDQKFGGDNHFWRHDGDHKSSDSHHHKPGCDSDHYCKTTYEDHSKTTYEHQCKPNYEDHCRPSYEDHCSKPSYGCQPSEPSHGCQPHHDCCHMVF